MVDVADRTKPSSIKIFDMGRLPTVEEVRDSITSDGRCC